MHDLFLALGIAGIFEHLHGGVQRDHRGRLRSCRHEDRGKILIGDARPVERASYGIATYHPTIALEPVAFKGGLPLDALRGLPVQATGGIACRVGLVSERGGPGRIGLHQLTVAGDQGLNLNDIRFVEAETLVDGDIFAGIIKSNRLWRVQVKTSDGVLLYVEALLAAALLRYLGNVEHVIQFLAQTLVVGPQ